MRNFGFESDSGLSGEFAKDDGILAAFAGARFMGGDHADIAEVVKVEEFSVAPGLIFNDLDVGGLREGAGDDVEFTLAVAFIHPDGGGGVGREERVNFPLGGFDGVDVALMFTVGKDLVKILQFLGEADDAAADGEIACPIVRLSGGGQGERAGRQHRRSDELSSSRVHSWAIY